MAGERQGHAPALLPLSALIVVTALATAAIDRGAYYPPGQWRVALLLIVAVVVARRAHRWSAADVRLLPLPLCAALTIWVLTRSVLSGGVGGGASFGFVLLLPGVAAVLLVVRRLGPGQRLGLADAAVALGVLVAASGWVGVAWRASPWALEDQRLWRAATTLTYANAAAGLLVPLALLAVARLALRPHRTWDALATYLLLVGVGATLSRGGAIALVAGVLVLARLVGLRAIARALGPPAIGAAVALIALAPSMPAASSPRPALAVAGLAAGLVVALISTTVLSAGGRRWLVALILVTLSAPATAAVVRGEAGSAITGARLTPVSSDRLDAARAALRLAAAHPLTGVGPGRALLSWFDSQGRVEVARYAHNEYLQVLIELGAVGLVLLLALLASLARIVRRGRAAAPAPELWAGATAGLTALALHSALDFLWHLHVIPLTAALLVGLTTPTIATSPSSGPSPTTSSKEEQPC